MKFRVLFQRGFCNETVNNQRYFFRILDGTSQKAERSFTIIELLREGEMISLRDVSL